MCRMATVTINDPSLCSNVLDLPLDLLTAICLQLDLFNLVRVSATCKLFRNGDGALETELPTTSPVALALRMLAFPGGMLTPSARPTEPAFRYAPQPYEPSTERPESWIAYLARCVRQRRCREAPPFTAGERYHLFVDKAGELLTCGKNFSFGPGAADSSPDQPMVAAMEMMKVRCVASGSRHNLALSWDGLVYCWGLSPNGTLL
jgi:hypothetical protein